MSERPGRTVALVADTTHQTVGERVRRLQAEAQHLARQHVQALTADLAAMGAAAAEIGAGGEAYPAGVRDLMRRLAEDCAARAQTLEALVARLPAAGG